MLGRDLWLNNCSYLPPAEMLTACPDLVRVDGRTGKVEAKVPLGGHPYGATRLGADTLVVHVDTGPSSPMWLTEIDARDNVPTAIYDLPASDFPGGVASNQRSLWLTNWTANTVSRLQFAAS